MIVAYREIRTDVSWESDLGEIYLTQEVAPGGYYWVFDKGDGKVNVGLGVQMTGSHPNPKEQLYRYVLSKDPFKGSRLEKGGGGMVPTRRPMDCLVSNGIMLVGDAACLVNPIHGGGIGPSMLSGKLAAETAAEALEKRNAGREALWQYNVEYMQSYGAKQASLDAFRLLLQEVSDDELNFGMKNELVKEEDVLKASLEGDLRLSIRDKAKRAIRGAGRLGLLLKLEKTAEKMREIKALYQDYPPPERFEQWRSKVNSIYETLRP
jgi:flavin-dependent dehydrogenase